MRKSIDDEFENFDESFSNAKKGVKAGCIGAGVGFVVGAVGGIYLGESINDYVEVLKQAPAAIQYGVDVASALVCGGVGASIVGALAQIPSKYKMSKKF